MFPVAVNALLLLDATDGIEDSFFSHFSRSHLFVFHRPFYKGPTIPEKRSQ